MTPLVEGRRLFFTKKLSTTAQTTVYSVPTDGSVLYAIALQMTLVKVDAGAATVLATVELTDFAASEFSAAGTYRFLYQYPVPVKPYDLDLLGLPMSLGDALKVTAGVADDLEVIGVVVEVPRGR